MKRAAWKWFLGISLVVLALLILFTFGAWLFTNIGSAILLTLMGNTELHTMPFSVFMTNFVGSPMFYIYLADLAVLLCSVTALVITKK